MGCRRALGSLLIGLALAAWPLEARGDRIFYRSALWLETSPGVQRLSLLGVLQAWETLAGRDPGEPLPFRQREFVRLHECLQARGHTTDDLLARLTRFSQAHPERTFYSFTDFATEALRPLC
jgi:hypothetical protein